MAFRDVPNADDVAVAPVEACLADGDFHRHAGSFLGDAPRLVGREIDVRIVDFGGATLEEFERPVLIDLGQQEIDGTTEDFGV